MEYSDALLAQFVPSEPPPFEHVPRAVLGEIESWVTEDDMERSLLVARSTQWTYAMFSELRLGRFSIETREWPWPLLLLPGMLENPVIGLFDPAIGPAGFGLIVYIAQIKELLPSVDAGRIHFDRLGKSFPVTMRPALIEDHGAPHPDGATSAAWARCDRSGQWGILTAGHAVDAPGAAVTLSSGGTGRVARSFHPRIDAAFVETVEKPSPATILTVRKFPAFGHRVRVGCRSAPADRTIVGVEDNMGVVRTLSRAAMLFTDKCCAGGDSGARVSGTNGDAVGIYLGALDHPNHPGNPLGRVLSLEQALYLLEVTPYK